MRQDRIPAAFVRGGTGKGIVANCGTALGGGSGHAEIVWHLGGMGCRVVRRELTVRLAA